MRSPTLTRNLLAVTFALTVTGMTVAAEDRAFAVTPPSHGVSSHDSPARGDAGQEGDARIAFHLSQANLGPGYSWGNGVLSFGGKEYAIRVEGGGAMALGYSTGCAHGAVTGLADAEQLDSTFWAVHAEATAGHGDGDIALQNSQGVEIHLTTRNQGARLAAAVERLRFRVLGPSKQSFASIDCH